MRPLVLPLACCLVLTASPALAERLVLPLAVPPVPEAASAGDPDAQFVMGESSWSSPAVARGWYQRAAAAGHVRAAAALGRMAMRGLGGPADPVAGLRWLEAGAAYSDGPALGEWGMWLRRQGDAARARVVLRRAADRDDMRSRYLYGLMLLQGEGGPVDRPDGLAELRAAAMGFDAARLALPLFTGARRRPSAVQLAIAARDAIGRPADRPLALRLLQAAGNQPDALYQLAVTLHEDGRLDEAEALRRRAAERDQPMAMYEQAHAAPDGGWLARAMALGNVPAADELAQHGLPGVQAAAAAQTTLAAAQLAQHKAALAGYAPAEYHLGVALSLGTAAHPQPDPAAGRPWLERAAARGNAEAAFMLAGEAKAPAEARPWLERALALGHPLAAAQLARLLAAGEGGPADPARAFQLYLRDLATTPQPPIEPVLALLAGPAPLDAAPLAAWCRPRVAAYDVAAALLGELTVTGRGVPKDVHEGLRLLQSAADRQLPAARRQLALHAEELPDAEALPILEEGAEAGDGTSLYLLALRARDGRGVPRDHDAYLRRLRDAADEQCPPAQLAWGRLVLEGREVPEARDRGVRLLSDAARTMPEARTALYAWRQDAQYITPAAPPFDQLRVMARRGDREAEHMLGLRYWKAPGPALDLVRAERWLRRASDDGDPGAAFDLAVLLSGDHAQPPEARALEARALAAGYPPARLSAARTKLEAQPPDLAGAVAQLEAAARAGNGDAQYELGMLYERGDQLPFDAAKAHRWLLAAAEHGHSYYWVAQVHDRQGGDAAEALRLYRLGAEAGDEMCMAQLGRLLAASDMRAALPWYVRGAHLLSDERFAWLQRTLREGPYRNPSAALHAALLRIDRTTNSHDEAIARYSPELGYPTLAEARIALAIAHERGEGFAPDPAEALFWYLSAGDLAMTYPEAAGRALVQAARLRRLGVLPAEPRFEFGRLLPAPMPDELDARAAKLLTDDQERRLARAKEANATQLAPVLADLAAAATGGNPRAQSDLAWLLAHGLGTPRDDAKAAAWWRRAADAGDLAALVRLGDRQALERATLAPPAVATAPAAYARALATVAALKPAPTSLEAAELGNQGSALAVHRDRPEDQREAYRLLCVAGASGYVDAQSVLPWLDHRLPAAQVAEIQAAAVAWWRSRHPEAPVPPGP